MRFTCRALGVLVGVASLTGVAPARASDIGPNGQLIFAKDALATYGFESFADLQAAGACTIAWTSPSSGDLLTTTPLAAGDAAAMLTSAALEGSQALVVKKGTQLGLALRDTKTLGAQTANRISVSMWGRSFGAEPVLEMLYAHNTTNVGPGRVHVFAIRTGRETSDGWVEYSTGPIDGSEWATPLRAIVLTARFATDDGATMLIDRAFGPSQTSPPQILDDSAYAVIDAVEVQAAEGPATPAATCTQATVETACAAGSECQFGHCIDGALVWGPVPPAADHRTDLVSRWAFLAGSLLSDRQAAATGATTFAGVVPAFMAATTPRAYYGALNQLVTGVRDSHTTLGSPPSSDSVLYPLADTYSGPLDVCLGLAENDLDTGETVFAVFSVGTDPSTTEVLAEGDVLTQVDGLTPTAWLAAVAPRFSSYQASDPAADPSREALLLPKLLGHYASSVTFSRCVAGSGCTALPPIALGDAAYQLIVANGDYKGSSKVCSLRFHPAVTTPPDDGATYDVPAVQQPAAAGGITSVQFDGFEGDFISGMTNPWSSWENPMTSAFQDGSNVLVDARLGHGGKFFLGKWMFQLLRGTDQPYGMFAVPRGAYDNPDPAWLLSASLGSCPSTSTGIDLCNWSGNNTAFTVNASPAGEPSKIAWVNGNDVSMNDIVPRLMTGRAAFRVFGPHPSHGSYGEISDVPPIASSWYPGSLQVLDMRFGATLADAQAGTWQSGHGVVPDQVVLQKVSDILLDQDTVLAAAQAWLAQ